MQDEKKREMSEVMKLINVEKVLEEFRRRSKEDSANIRIPWEKPTDFKFVGNVREVNREAHFVTGSKYIGTWDATGMAGVGRYTMPHGVIFEGEFRDSVIHGRGTLEWPQKQRIDGVWLRGKLQEKRYTFSDGLVFQEKDWDYCRFPDRRFVQCIKKGLNPAGRTLKTARQPSPVIPPSCYDTGDGIFNPNTLTVSSYQLPHKVMRNTTNEEAKWIMENCRKDSISPVGYQPLLNENWSTDPPNLPYSLPMSSDSPQSWWKRLTTFEKDVEVKVDNEEPVLGGEDISNDLCNCYEINSAEESFYSTSSEDHCICLKNKKSKTDILEEEYLAFREIVCDQLDKYDNFDLTNTVCIPPQSRKASSADLVDIKSQKLWEDDLYEENIEDNVSDLSVEKAKRVIEYQKLLDEAAIKGSSLAENKLDMEDIERMKEDEIEETEEAEEELEEILRFSNKQEMDRKNRIKEEELPEVVEDTIEASLVGKEVLEDSKDKEDKTEYIEAFKESEDINSNEGTGEDNFKASLQEEENLKSQNGKEDQAETDNLEKIKQTENEDPTEEVKEDKLTLSNSSIERKLENSASEKSSKDALKSSEEEKEKNTSKLKTHDLLEGKSSREEIKDDETKLFSRELLKSSQKDQKPLQTRSSPQLQDKQYKSGKEADFRFSTTFDAPRSKLEFVRKPCHPNICSKDAPKGCAQISENDPIPSCKPRKAIEMVQLRVANKRCHE